MGKQRIAHARCNRVKDDYTLQTSRNRAGKVSRSMPVRLYVHSRFLLGFFWPVLVVIAACSYPSPGNDKPWVRRVPNTAGALSQLGCMFVSPGAEWVAFLEKDDRGNAIGFASVEIATGRRIAHDIAHAPCLDAARLPDNPLIAILSDGGERTGWFDGTLYIDNPTGMQSALVVVDSLYAVGCVRRIPGQPMVIDGPPWGYWCLELAQRAEYVGYVNYDLYAAWIYTSSWRGDHYAATTYGYDVKSESLVAYERGSEGSTIVELPGDNRFRRVALAAIRVSPDGRFLAYVLGFRSALIPSPYMADVMYVLDLSTGTKRAMCSFNSIGSFHWTSDSRTLFVAGGGAVYTLDMSVAFRL